MESVFVFLKDMIGLHITYLGVGSFPRQVTEGKYMSVSLLDGISSTSLFGWYFCVYFVSI